MALNDDLRERLSAYLDDEVTPQERADVEAWLASDPSARVELEAMRRVSRAVGGLPRAAAGPELAERVISQIEREALLAKQDAPRTTLGRGWLAGLGAAAVLVLAVTIALRSRARVAETAGEKPVLTVADAENSQPVATDAPSMMSPSVSEESEDIDQLRARFDSGSRPTDLDTAARPNAVEIAPSAAPMSKAASGASGEGEIGDTSLSYAYLYQRKSRDATTKRGTANDESAPAVRAMARAEDRDEILYRLYQFVEASPSAEFVEAEISEMALVIPGLDWLFLGLPVGGTASSADQIEITLDEADVPELLAVLQPIPGTRYELRSAEIPDAPVSAGRLAARRGRASQTPSSDSDEVPHGAPAAAPSAAAVSENPSREIQVTSQPAADGNRFEESRRVRVVVSFQQGHDVNEPATGAASATQPAGARP